MISLHSIIQSAQQQCSIFRRVNKDHMHTAQAGRSHLLLSVIFISQVVSLCVLLGVGKPSNFTIEDLRNDENEDLMETTWGPILEAVTIEEDDRDGDEERAISTPDAMVFIELSDDEAVTMQEENKDEEQDVTTSNVIELSDHEDLPGFSTNLPNETHEDPVSLSSSRNKIALSFLQTPKSTVTSSTAGTSAESNNSGQDTNNPEAEHPVCQCPKTRRGKQALCKLCKQRQSNKKKGAKVLRTRKRSRRGLAEGWQEGQGEGEVMGVEERRWRGPRFPCNKCKYVAGRQVNLDNHKASKHEGVMFMDSYISDYFAKNRLVFI